MSKPHEITAVTPTSRAGRWLALVVRAALVLLAVGAVALSVAGYLARQAAPAAAQAFTCPMHPQIRADRAGSCPICGMDLVPAGSAGSAAPAAGSDSDRLTPPATATTMHLSTERAQRLGVRTVRVASGTRARSAAAFAALRVDDASVFRVEALTSGWLRELAPLLPGDRLKRGAVVGVVYSREVEQAEVEWRIARDGGIAEPADADALRNASAERLRSLGVDRRALGRRGANGRGTVAVVAARAGTVLRRDATLGAYVGAGAALRTGADLSTLQLVIELPVKVAAEVAPGTALRMTIGPLTVEATVDALEPTVQPAAQVRRARARVDNSDGRLAAGTVGTATVTLPPRSGLWLPVDAVIDSGAARYVLRLVEGQVLPTTVEIGVRVGEEVLVERGVREGDVVVRRANMLLDADSRIAAAASSATAALDPAAAVTASDVDRASDVRATSALPLGHGGDPKAALAAFVTLQQALVAGDAAAASRNVATIAATAPQHGALASAAESFPTDLVGQRARLAALAEAAIALAAAYPAAATDLRVIYCSMAPGRWLQPPGLIANPYFGASMLRCGEDQGPASGGAQ